MNEEYCVEYTYQPDSFVLAEKFEYAVDLKLKTKTNRIAKTLLQAHVYSPDFLIEWTQKGIEKFCQRIWHHRVTEREKKISTSKIFLLCSSSESYIDVKGGFSIYNNHREFSINQKWMLQKHDIYVQKIDPIKIFQKTFYPERFLWTDGATRRRMIKNRCNNG